MGIECELAPLRSLDDFLLGSARFQLPNFQDIDKWGNRVTKNFLYYQTNYFVVYLIVTALLTICNPLPTVLGAFAFAAVLAALVIINPTEIQGQPKHNKCTATNGWVYVLSVVAAIAFVLYLFESFTYVLFMILLPFCLAFVHASLRLRNLRNKLSNTIDEQRLRYTPMGVFLEALTIVVDSVNK